MPNVHLSDVEIDLLCDALRCCLGADCDGIQKGPHVDAPAIWRNNAQEFVDECELRPFPMLRAEAEEIREENDMRADLIEKLAVLLPKEEPATA